MLQATARIATNEAPAEDDHGPLDHDARPRLVHPVRPDATPAIGLVGTSVAISQLRREIARIAPLSASVVIHGETGTGKERVARALHDHGLAPGAPFLAVNCAALERHLLCSELFGHEQGAYTGATRERRGLFERASGGTLFLDEIGELPAEAQAMLLRVLETGELRRLGGETTRRVRVRVVAATHRSLAKMVTAGTFRADLLWRLHVLIVNVPALRERRDDIAILAAEIMDELAPEIGWRSLDEGALDLLRGYAWPGNVRQLKTVLRRAAAGSALATLRHPDIARAIAAEPFEAKAVPVRRIPSPSAAAIRDALRQVGGRLSGAARMLGIPRTTLRERMRRLGIAHG